MESSSRRITHRRPGKETLSFKDMDVKGTQDENNCSTHTEYTHPQSTYSEKTKSHLADIMHLIGS